MADKASIMKWRWESLVKLCQMDGERSEMLQAT